VYFLLLYAFSFARNIPAMGVHHPDTSALVIRMMMKQEATLQEASPQLALGIPLHVL